MNGIAQPDLTQTYDITASPWNLRGLPFSPGDVVWTPDGAKAYRFILAEDANIAAGNVVAFTSTDDKIKVSNDRSGGTSVTKPAGVAPVAITDGHYGWIQCHGLADVATVTDGGVSADEDVVMHATTDGGLDSAGAGTIPYEVVGHALDADVSTTLAAGKLDIKCDVTPQGSFVA